MAGESGRDDEVRVGDALRAAIERTLAATAPARERAGELVDEIARRGHEAREEIARRGEEAGAELAKRGQELSRRGQEAAPAELSRQLQALERRMAVIEELLRRRGDQEAGPRPEAEG